MAIQLKMHWEVDNDLTGLDQLETAFKEHNVDAALLVSLVDKLGSQLSSRIDSLKQEYKIGVLTSAVPGLIQTLEAKLTSSCLRYPIGWHIGHRASERKV